MANYGEIPRRHLMASTDPNLGLFHGWTLASRAGTALTRNPAARSAVSALGQDRDWTHAPVSPVDGDRYYHSCSRYRRLPARQPDRRPRRAPGEYLRPEGWSAGSLHRGRGRASRPTNRWLERRYRHLTLFHSPREPAHEAGLLGGRKHDSTQMERWKMVTHPAGRIRGDSGARC